MHIKRVCIKMLSSMPTLMPSFTKMTAEVAYHRAALPLRCIYLFVAPHS